MTLVKALFHEIFEEDKFIRTKPTTILQNFFKYMSNEEIIFKNTIDPDDTCQGDPPGMNRSRKPRWR